MVDRFSLIEEVGFETVPQVIIKSWEEHYDEYIKILKEIAQEKGFPIDGLVMTYNDISYGESLGMTGHHPKHSLAFKFYDEEVTTTLKDIEWTMGKTGVLTPVADLPESTANLSNIKMNSEIYDAELFAHLTFDPYSVARDNSTIDFQYRIYS